MTDIDHCEDYRDCELPTETYQSPKLEDGDTVTCTDCGREWEYSNGWFTQTGRVIEAGMDQEAER